MNLTVSSRYHLTTRIAEYAEERFGRLGRYTGLHDLKVMLHHDTNHVPPARVDVIGHLGHAQFAVHGEGRTEEEAIDVAFDKATHHVTRYKDKLTEHKGHASAGSDGRSPGPRGV